MLFPKSIRYATVAGLVFALGACNPAKFDDLADEMWVTSSGAPDGLDSNDYADGIVWGGSADAGGTFYAIGNRPAWAELAFNAQGKLTNSALRVNSFLQGADVLTSTPSIAADPGSIGATGAKGTVALGTSQGGAAFVVLLHPNTFSFTDSISLSDSTELVDALAMGPTNAGTSGSDIVVVRSRPSDSRLSVILDYQDAGDNFVQPSCTLTKEEGYSAAVANLDSVSPDSEIIVGMGSRSRSSGMGHVLILAGSLVVDTQAIGDDLPCTDGGALLATIDAPMGEPDFGAAIAVGDFDGDGANGGAGNDLAISAPSANRVYVYFNVDTSAALGTPIEITPPPGAEAYGTSLAAGDFDGDGADELVIGDPSADVDAVINSGRADIVVFSGGAVADSHTVLDAEAENSQNFGRAVAVATFNGVDILAVGARDEVFTYFRTPVTGDVDDRQ